MFLDFEPLFPVSKYDPDFTQEIRVVFYGSL